MTIDSFQPGRSIHPSPVLKVCGQIGGGENNICKKYNHLKGRKLLKQCNLYLKELEDDNEADSEPEMAQIKLQLK